MLLLQTIVYVEVVMLWAERTQDVSELGNCLLQPPSPTHISAPVKLSCTAALPLLLDKMVTCAFQAGANFQPTDFSESGHLGFGLLGCYLQPGTDGCLQHLQEQAIVLSPIKRLEAVNEESNSAQLEKTGMNGFEDFFGGVY